MILREHALPIKAQELNLDWVTQERKGHEHFMLKEIYEQKEVIHATVDFLKQIIQFSVGLYGYYPSDQAKYLNVFTLLACGTSWHAASIGKFFFEYITKIPTYVHLASEFRYMPFFPTANSLYVAVSQSGETADTLEAMRMLQASHRCRPLLLSNVASSTMIREAGGFLLTQAGYEIAVVSTKAFSAQLTVLYWLANRVALEKGLITAASNVYGPRRSA